jgi:hypothetical protein
MESKIHKIFVNGRFDKKKIVQTKKIKDQLFYRVIVEVVIVEVVIVEVVIVEVVIVEVVIVEVCHKK